MTSYADTEAVTLADVRQIVTLSEMYRFNGDEWSTYDATIVSRGREYSVAKITEYDDESRGLLVLRHYDLRTQAQWRAWNAITDLFGMARPEAWQTPYAMAPSLSY